MLQILAEPNLMAISGQPAHFLAGGEFPYPVVQGGSGGTGFNGHHSVQAVRGEAGVHGNRSGRRQHSAESGP